MAGTVRPHSHEQQPVSVLGWANKEPAERAFGPPTGEEAQGGGALDDLLAVALSACLDHVQVVGLRMRVQESGSVTTAVGMGGRDDGSSS